MKSRSDFALHRILDAAANRALEGIRVVEDYVRFAMDDQQLTLEIKHFRHELATVLKNFPEQHRLIFRDTTGDIGTVIEGSHEYSRHSMDHVLQANFSRLQESLRSLEEYSKVIAPEISRIIEQLRYRSYTLQKTLFHQENASKRLEDARLYLLVDARNSESEFAALVQTFIDGGVDLIQLRDKKIDDRTLLHRAKLLRRLTLSSKTLFIMNDRPDLAVLAQADGVHLGQEELPIQAVRTLVGPQMLIGLSTHSLEQTENAVVAGADYIGVGPVFPSNTKSFEAFPGLHLLEQVAAATKLPAFAIGGINQKNLPQVLTTGFRRIAIQSAITDSPCPKNALREILENLS